MSNPILLLVILISYANSLIYIFKKHTKFFGFIIMIIAFILSLIYASSYYNDLSHGLEIVTSHTALIFLVIIVVVFLHLYNLTKVLNAYSNRTNKKKSFNIQLNKKFSKYLDVFTYSLIVGIALLYLFVFVFVMQYQHPNLMEIMGVMIALLVAAITTETIHAVKFAKIKG
jgi:hypothetical protein